MSELDEILKNISLTGNADSETAEVKQIIATRELAVQRLIDRSSGLPRIKPHLVRNFSFILSQPLALRALSNLNIRCCLCGSVIFYPAWYSTFNYARNVIHYFICLDIHSPTKVTAKCLRK